MPPRKAASSSAQQKAASSSVQQKAPVRHRGEPEYEGLSDPDSLWKAPRKPKKTLNPSSNLERKDPSISDPSPPPSASQPPVTTSPTVSIPVIITTPVEVPRQQQPESSPAHLDPPSNLKSEDADVSMQSPTTRSPVFPSNYPSPHHPPDAMIQTPTRPAPIFSTLPGPVLPPTPFLPSTPFLPPRPSPPRPSPPPPFSPKKHQISPDSPVYIEKRTLVAKKRAEGYSSSSDSGSVLGIKGMLKWRDRVVQLQDVSSDHLERIVNVEGMLNGVMLRSDVDGKLLKEMREELDEVRQLVLENNKVVDEVIAGIKVHEERMNEVGNSVVGVQKAVKNMDASIGLRMDVVAGSLARMDGQIAELKVIVSGLCSDPSSTQVSRSQTPSPALPQTSTIPPATPPTEQMKPYLTFRPGRIHHDDSGPSFTSLRPVVDAFPTNPADDRQSASTTGQPPKRSFFVADDWESRKCQNGVYLGASGYMYAELKEANADATYSLLSAPPVPYRLEGRWVLTDEDPPRWRFEQSEKSQTSPPPPPPSRQQSSRSVPPPDEDSDIYGEQLHHQERASKDRSHSGRHSSNRHSSRQRSPDRSSRRRSPTRSSGRRRRSSSPSGSASEAEARAIIRDKPRTIPSHALPAFDPNEGATHQFCKQLRTLRIMYGENSVIAAIPGLFKDKLSQAWFASNSMSRSQMMTVEGWIEALRSEFAVNPATSRSKALERRYNPDVDGSVGVYFYDKLNLWSMVKDKMSRKESLDEIWNGLPDTMRMLLNYDDFRSCELADACKMLRDKDPSFRKAWKRLGNKSEPRDSYRSNRNRNYRQSRQSHKSDRSSDDDKPADKSTSRSSRSFNAKSSSYAPRNSGRKALTKKEKERIDREFPIPEILPETQWRKDKDGKLMKRKCRFCSGWHYDWSCSKKPASYNVYALSHDIAEAYSDDFDVASQSFSSSSESSSSSYGFSSSESDEPSPKRKPTHVSESYATNQAGTADSPIKIPRAEEYTIQPIPPALSVGTGISYLSARPCPIKVWLGVSPHGDVPLTSGVADSGGPSIIQESLIPTEYRSQIRPSPLNPTFRGVGDSQTGVQGYVVLPVYFPNISAMSGDKRNAKVVLVWVEFQIMKKLAAGFLYGRDAMKPYGVVIDEQRSRLVFTQFDPPIGVPMADSLKPSKSDPANVHAAESFSLKPREEKWIQIKFDPPDEDTDLLLSPIRRLGKSEGSYAACPYAVMSKATNHVLFINPGRRIVKIKEGEVVGKFEPLPSNTPYTYFGLSDPPQEPQSSDTPAEATPKESTPAKPSPFQPTDIAVDDVPIDPFGLEDEFRKDGPLEEQPVDDEEKEKGDLEWDICPKLTRRQRRDFLRMLRKHILVFSGPEMRLGKVIEKYDMDIRADINKIRSQQPYRTSPKKRQMIIEAVDKLLKQGIARESSSPVASPVVVVIQHGKPRFCVDLREVNSKTEADRYAIPRQDSIFAALIGALFFSLVDCNKGYHQLGLTERSRQLTAFVTEHGFFEYLRVPFGLRNAPSHFQRVIDNILGAYRWDFCCAFIDDIIIYSRTFEEHLRHVSLVLEALERVGMTLSELKCHFGYDNIQLLGHRVSRLGLSTLREKVDAILAVPFPETVKQALVILGMFNYYRAFIPHFALIAAPLYDALKMTPSQRKEIADLDSKERAKVRARWTFLDSPATRDAFEKLRQALTDSPVLIHPDFTREFILYCDACRKGIAAVLQQVCLEDMKEHPILYVSRRLSSAESHYGATELECLAVVWALDKLSHYLDGSTFKLVTDHSALKWIWDIKASANSRLFRWSLILNPLKDKVTIIHRPGKFHQNADTLSRFPCYTVTLVHMSEEWIEKLWNGYHSDVFLRKVIENLEEMKRKGEALREKSKEGNMDQDINKEKVQKEEDILKADNMNGGIMGEEMNKNTITKEKENGLPDSGEEDVNGLLDIDGEKEDGSFEYLDTSLLDSTLPPMDGTTTGPHLANVTLPSEDPGSIVRELEQVVQTTKKDKDVISDGTFTLIGKVLYFSERRHGELRLCIPDEFVDELVKDCHVGIGHPGIRRTYEAIHHRFYFKRMSKRIKSVVNECVACQTSKPSNEKPMGQLYPIPVEDPLHTITMDFVTGLPKSNGKDALLTVTDKFSKAVRLIPCTEKTTAEETAKLYIQYCYPIFGLPVKIISDRDGRFTSRLWSTLMALLGIKLGLTSAYHPAADGQSEKSNQIVEIALRCWIAGDELKYKSWTQYLPILEHELNSLTQSSTGFTPNELRFAAVPLSIPDVLNPLPPGQPSVSENAELLAEDLRNRRDEARDSVAIAQRKQKRYADKGRSAKQFEVGDLVVLKFRRFGPGYKPLPAHKSKLGPIGTPLRIIEKLSPVSYRLALPAGSQIHDVVSIVHLSRFHGEGKDVRPLPIVGDVNDELAEWEVEKIEGSRTTKGSIEYLVKWLGYEERSWEPVEHLENAKGAIEDWQAEQIDRRDAKRAKWLKKKATLDLAKAQREEVQKLEDERSSAGDYREDDIVTGEKDDLLSMVAPGKEVSGKIKDREASGLRRSARLWATTTNSINSNLNSTSIGVHNSSQPSVANSHTPIAAPNSLFASTKFDSSSSPSSNSLLASTKSGGSFLLSAESSSSNYSTKRGSFLSSSSPRLAASSKLPIDSPFLRFGDSSASLSSSAAIESLTESRSDTSPFSIGLPHEDSRSKGVASVVAPFTAVEEDCQNQGRYR